MKRHGLRKKSELVAVRSEVSNEILEIFRRPVKYVPGQINKNKYECDREFQLFEVLSTYLMSLIESGFEWTVTPLQHDQGVDFYGEKILFQLPGLEEQVRVTIAGQCKASKNAKTPLPSDLWRLLRSVNPTIVFVFWMSDISKKRILDAQATFSERTFLQCRILGINEVLVLFKLYRQEILHLLHESLNPKDERILRDFIEQLPSIQSENLEVETRVPEKVLAGTPFHVHVKINSLLVCRSGVCVRWNYPPDVLLIKPMELISSDGLRLEAEDGFCSSFSIKFVSYYVGEVSLGELVFEIEGSPPKSVSLGSAVTVDQYHPIFFWEPYQQHRVRFLELLDKAEAHAPVGIAVTGQGGAGKTRVCQELGYLAEQRGAELISISHPQDLEHPHKIFGLLAQELLGNPFDDVSPKEALEAYILSLQPKLHQRAKGTIATIFSSETGNCGVFDREVMLQILLVMLLQKAKARTYILHFSDLHWASSEALEILGDLLQRLGKMAVDYRASVLILFEGRVQTELRQSNNGNAPVSSTAIFESFIERYQLERFDIKAFSTTQSRAFLTHLFENAQSANRCVPRELIPHQKVLIEAISRYGQGNPFHMLEQIKLLRQEGLIGRNARTGLIYLSGFLKSSYQVPTSVYELIALRLKFIRKVSPELGLLIQAVGLIKDRIDAQLFRKLHRSLAGHTPASAIQEMEILNTDNPSEVSFRHENYYQVVNGSPLSQSERQKITAIYLNWYRDLHPKTAVALYEEALVHTNRLRVQFPVVKRLLNTALRKAETCHQYQLAIQIIEKLLNVAQPDSVPEARPSTGLITTLNLRMKLADFSQDLKDWNLGAEQYERVITDIDDILQETAVTTATRGSLAYLRTSATVELANCQTDLGKSHEGIRLLTEARRICETYFELGVLTNEKLLDKWHILYSRILNRLGEAHWMDGNYEEALRSQEAAITATEELVRQNADRELLHHINFLDYGAVLLHRNPSKAVKMLRKSLSLIPERGWPPRYNILASTTLVIGEMVELFLREHGNSPRLQRFLQNRALPQLQHDFERALFYGFKQEQVAASLTMGIGLSLLGDSSAVKWYMESIEISFKSNNLESLWRGHLNLAQYLNLTGEVEGCLFHCNRARQLLSKDLRARAPEEREWRKRHLTRPLIRLARLLPKSELSTDPFIYAMLEELKKESVREEQINSSSFFSDKIIFIQDEGNEYYTYGG